MLLVFLVLMLILCTNLLLIAYKDTKVPKEVLFLRDKKCLSVDKKVSASGKNTFWIINFEGSNNISYYSIYPLEVGKAYSFWYDTNNSRIKIPIHSIKDCVLLISLIVMIILLIILEVILCTG